MSRIFSSLSITSLALILLTLTYGVFGGDYNGLAQQLQQSRREQQSPSNFAGPAAERQRAGATGQDADQSSVELRQVQWHARNHMLLGIFAAIITALVQSIGVTYFIGTGRWFKEVSDAYTLSPEIVQESVRIKRSSFPFAMLGIATILAIAALGAAADPGTLRETTGSWVAPHYWTAIIGLCVIAFSLQKQAGAIRRNQQLIDRVMQLVHDARIARQLPV